MKKLVLTFAFFGFAFAANAQIGIGTPTPHESAILEIEALKKGVLIPRTHLIQTTQSTPVDNPANSLLIYNEATANDVTPGFYYWVDVVPAHWERIVNQQQLDDVINNFYDDLANLHELINYIAPTNPDADPTNTLTHHTIVWDEADNQFKFVRYNTTTEEYYTTQIDLEALVQDFETDTSIIEANEGTILDNNLEIIYNYLKEAYLKDPTNIDPDTIDITEGVLQSILHNENVQQSIINLIQEGGTVFYGNPNDPLGEPYLYYIDENGDDIRIDTAVVVDGTDNNVASTVQINQIKTNLGDVYSTTTATFTGDTWIDDSMIYKGIYDATIVQGTATLLSPITLGGFTSIGNVISIRLLDTDNNIINTATTDVSVSGTALNFNIGTGNMYNVLNATAATPIKVLVEFSAEE